MNYKKEIPTIAFPSIDNYCIQENHEKLISLTKAGFLCDSQYYNQGIPGSLKDCYARESVVEKLKIAENLLPNNLKFKIYDAYRPICVQQRLWNFYEKEIKMKFPDISPDELEKKVSFFVSKPSFDIQKPSLHNTGGSIDLTLVTKEGYALNMGTLFDDFTERAWTNHFEQFTNCNEVRDNRRILYNVMIEAGFTNLPSEWWHYDYGTKFWGYFKNQNPIYEGILTHDFIDTYPLS